MNVKNVLTIDLEEWYHANYSDNLFDNNNNYEVRVINSTQRILDLLKKYNAKATFFTLGLIAEKHPELIKLIHDNGHEISSHGYAHQLVYKQNKYEFEDDLKKSIHFIEKAIGEKPLGYRAPSWSLNKDTSWVIPILKNNGFQYDASVFPVKTFLYGIPEAPRFPFRIINNNDSVFEFPTSTFRFLNKNIPFSGGFYFRFMPYKFINFFFNSINKRNRPVVFYLHPREIDPEQPRLEGLNFRDRFIHYYQINNCDTKLEKLLKDFTFITMKSYFEKEGQSLNLEWNI